MSRTAIAILSAIILIFASSISVFGSVRFFCVEHPGVLIVVFAVAGEVICDWNRKKSLRERLKKFFGILLVAGLLLEIVEAVKADKQVAVANLEAKQAETNAAASYEHARVAEQKAGEANEHASTNELAAKQLEKQLNETKTQLAIAEARLNESVANLRTENSPMDIGEQYSFISALKPMAGIQVELRCVADGKAQQTAEALRSTFSLAGWPIINFHLIGDIGAAGIVIGYGHDEPSERAAHLVFNLLTERGVPSKIIDDPMGLWVRGVPTNAIIVAVCQRPTQSQANLMAVQARQKALQDQESKIRDLYTMLPQKKPAF